MRWPWWLAPSVYILLTLAMFGDVLVAGDGRIISAPQTDLTMHFAASREFGFGELAGGNLPLWNPRMFSGYPYFGGFQPALLYPLNWPYLILPLGFAINSNIALHVMLAGYFVWLWLRRECGDFPALAGGVVFMFCARFFLHVYAGHLPHVCLVPWMALLLLSIDGLTRDGRLTWALLGAWSSAMMLLAGYPQMLYYALVVLPIYACWRWFASPVKWRALGGFALIGILALGMSAAQLWAGVEAAEESIRRDGTSYEFAASFSFPPENLLTLIAPEALGRLPESVLLTPAAPYFGQAYGWETIAHVGALATLLAIIGAASGRGALLPVVMVLVTVLLGLGANTPLHRWMYDWFPGFSTFRGTSKFLYLSSLFIAQLAAMGLASIVGRPRRRWPVVLAAALLMFVASLGVAIRRSAEAGPDGAFAGTMKAIADRAAERQDAYYPRSNFDERPALRLMGRTSAASFYWAGTWFLAGGAAIAAARWRPRAASVVIVALVAVESFTFARTNRPTSPLVTELPLEWTDALRALVPDGTRFVRNPSQYEYRGPELSRALDAWGYDPGILQRYAELMCLGQDMPRDSAKFGLSFRKESPAVFRLARIATVLTLQPPHYLPAAFPIRAPPLPRALIVPNAVVLPGDDGREAIDRILTSSSFDPANTVLLEEEPAVRPSLTGARPAVDFREIDSDTRRIGVDLPAAGILLVTESYSRHWQARSATGGADAEYRVMPGNAAFIAIPLTAGRHEILLEYRPLGWIAGRWISLAAVCIFVGLLPVARRRADPAPVAPVVQA